MRSSPVPNWRPEFVPVDDQSILALLFFLDDLSLTHHFRYAFMGGVQLAKTRCRTAPGLAARPSGAAAMSI